MLNDLVELHRARTNIHQAYDAIATTGMQGKPAVLGSLDQADDTLLYLIEKGSKRALRFVQMRPTMRTRVPASFIELLKQLVPAPAEERATAGSEQPQNQPKFITAGRNGSEAE